MELSCRGSLWCKNLGRNWCTFAYTLSRMFLILLECSEDYSSSRH